MHVELFHPAVPIAAHAFLHAHKPEADAPRTFQSLPMNLTADEIRAMVLEVMG